MKSEEIAKGMLKITSKFQQETVLTDKVINRIIEHCFRKMELTNQSVEYILILLPDELRNYCFRYMVNTQSIEIASERR